MAEQAEQKRLPASEKKLREAHKRGQVSQSKDLVSAFVLVAAMAYVYFVAPTTLEQINELIDLVTQPIGADGSGFGELSQRAIRKAGFLLLLLTGPLVGLIFLFTAIFGMIATRGPVFSGETIKPRFEQINPVEGFKKIASRRNVIEFLKGLAKLVVLGAVLTTVLMAWMQPLFVTPGCGAGCIQPTLFAMLIPLGGAVGLAFIVIGILDVPIQRWLFLQDMRMTTTEYKREQKDMEGDPLIRQALQRRRREASNAPKVGLAFAVMVLKGNQKAIGIRYREDETPVPAIVAKAQNAVAAEMLLQAGESGIPIIEDAELVEAIYGESRVGDFIEEARYGPVVRYLVRLGLT